MVASSHPKQIHENETDMLGKVLIHLEKHRPTSTVSVDEDQFRPILRSLRIRDDDTLDVESFIFVVSNLDLEYLDPPLWQVDRPEKPSFCFFEILFGELKLILLNR